jgi:hypothetical protein
VNLLAHSRTFSGGMSRGLKMTPSINSFLNPSTVFNPSLKPCCANNFTARQCQIVKQDARESVIFLASQGGFNWAQVCHRADPCLVGQSTVSKCLSTALPSSAFWDFLSTSPSSGASVSATPFFQRNQCSTHRIVVLIRVRFGRSGYSKRTYRLCSV